MATHFSILAWEIPWTGAWQSTGSQESGMTERFHFHFSLSCIGEGNGNPLWCSYLENPRDREAWWAALYGVAQSRTGLKRLSSSSSSHIKGTSERGRPSLTWPGEMKGCSSPQWNLALLDYWVLYIIVWLLWSWNGLLNWNRRRKCQFRWLELSWPFYMVYLANYSSYLKLLH